MKTKVNYLKVIGVLLCALATAGSSNHRSTLGFWHVLNGYADPVQAYWQFPDYFSAHLPYLPDATLSLLARRNISTAQYVYSLKLLQNKQGDTAKLFWHTNIQKMTMLQRNHLAEQLLINERWDDLKFLTKHSLISNRNIINHLQLHSAASYKLLPNSFLEQLGFASLNSLPKVKSHCLFNVLMLSDHRRGLYQLAALTKKYKQQPEPSEGVFCFSDPTYVAQAIQCGEFKKKAHCDWPSSSLKSALFTGFDFIVMMPKFGSANVHGNIMQLNSSANYDIFLHELMHFNGFEDEYILPISKQMWLCKQSGYVAPNLFISQHNLPPDGWYKSESCQQGGQAYKPTSEWSIMQYQQMGLSKKYRALWKKQIETVIAKSKIE